jgi:hypothetical protein
MPGRIFMNRLVLGLLLINASAWALGEKKQETVEYRRAQESDIPSVVSLMEESSSEIDKLVVLPTACREPFVRELVEKKHLFVAAVDNKVVATKKLFVTEGAEREDIIKNVIRSEGERARRSFRGKVNEGGIVVPYPNNGSTTSSAPAYGVCIYDGFDFTGKAFRGRGMNTGLFNVAFDTIAPQVKDALRKKNQKNVTLLYGVTYPNAGKKPGEDSDRMPSIARSFQSFLRRHIVDKKAYPIVLEHSRYHIVMPTFDQNSQECKLLPEEMSVPAYGCVLTYELKDNCI